MSTKIIIFIFISIIVLIATYIFSVTIKKFKESFVTELERNLENIEQLKEFNYDIHFDPFPNTIDITNPYACTPLDRHLCQMDDQTSCFGCQNLISRCTHFAQATKYVDLQGNEYEIPANSNPNEGYCLLTERVSESCNSFHGDLVLVQTSVDSTESAFICNCKNPGYIGKTSITGNCTDVFICNGNIKTLDVPFDQIECSCGIGETSKMENDIPVCITDTVLNHDYNNSVIFSSLDSLEASYFNSTFSGNTNTPYFRNPCMYCLITGEPVDGRIIESDDGYQCQSTSYDAIPVRSNSLGRILRGVRGPDAMIKMTVTAFRIYGYFSNTNFSNGGIIVDGRNGDNARLFPQFGLDPTRKYEISTWQHDISLMGSFSPSIITRINTIGICSGSWPTYQCRCRLTWQGENLQTGLTTSLSHGNYTTYVYGGRQCPSMFLWNRDVWDNTEQRLNVIVYATSVNNVQALVNNPYAYGQGSVPSQAAVIFTQLEIDPDDSRFLNATTYLDRSIWARYIGNMIATAPEQLKMETSDDKNKFKNLQNHNYSNVKIEEITEH